MFRLATRLGFDFTLGYKHRHTIMGLVISLCCSSCASVYVSSLRNTPLFERKGEFQGSASFGNGANVNVAYALTNHIGITAGGMYSNNSVINWKNTFRKHQSAEVALGYFTSQDKVSFETYVGYGGGHGYAQDSVFGLFFFANTQQTAEGSYHRYFIQPTLGFRPSRVVMAITMRFSYVEFEDLKVMTDNVNPLFLRNKGSFVFEPCFTTKFFVTRRPTSMYVFGQVGFNVADQSGDVRYNMPLFMPHWNVGVGIRLLKEDD